MLCTASVTYENGEELSRTVLEQTVQTQPVDEVIARGTGAEADAQEEIQYPVIRDGIIITETGEVLTYTDAYSVLATAYYVWPGSTGITATGTYARVGEIAVDPSVIPLGTRMFIVSDDGEYVYGIATAEDTGSLIVGNRVDLFYDTYEECIQFGARDCTVYILD